MVLEGSYGWLRDVDQALLEFKRAEEIKELLQEERGSLRERIVVQCQRKCERQ